MEDDGLEGRRFPVGRNIRVTRHDPSEARSRIRALADFPALVRAKVEGLDDAGLDRRYRPGGWTVRQVVHHLGDSHTNAYIRFKWALTEERPTIKPYFEDRWAELPDSRTGPVEVALRGLEGIHGRWVALLETLDERDFARSFFHPETGKEIFLFESLATYAWHGRHHLAHIDLALAS